MASRRAARNSVRAEALRSPLGNQLFNLGQAVATLLGGGAAVFIAQNPEAGLKGLEHGVVFVHA